MAMEYQSKLVNTNHQALSGGFFHVYATQLLTHARKRLERASIASGGHFLKQSTHGFIQG